MVRGYRIDDFGRLAILAREFGADHTIDVEAEDTVSRVLDLTGGAGADIVLELTPMAAQPVLDAVHAVRWGGRVVLVDYAHTDDALKNLLETARPLMEAMVQEITGVKVVNHIVTEMAYITVTDKGLLLEEVAPGLTADDVQRATEARLIVSPNLKTMSG